MYNNDVKRSVQKILFSKINDWDSLSFAGLIDIHNDANSYINMVLSNYSPEYYQALFVNREKSIQLYPFGASKYTYGLDITEIMSKNIMDCDFCSTVINSGKELLKVKCRMNYGLVNKDKYLLYTFSLRPVSQIDTLNWLNNNIFDGTLLIESEQNTLLNGGWNHYIKEIVHNQFIYKQSHIYSYRNNGFPMISGLIQW